MTLDSLSRQDMLNVLEQLRYYLGINDAANRRIAEINQYYTSGYNYIKKRKRIRIIVCFFMCFMSTTSIIYSLMLAFYQQEILGYILLIIIIVVLASVCIYSVFRTKKDRINYERFCSGVYAYIPAYEKVRNENLTIARNIQQRYNIQEILFSVDAVTYVMRILTSNSRTTLFEAIQDYSQYLHNERMYAEAQKQTAMINQIRRENKAYYDNALSKMDEIAKLERERNNMLNYAVYWK